MKNNEKQPDSNKYTEAVLQKTTVAELKEIFRDSGLKAKSKMRKAELISLILDQKEGTLLDDATKKLAERIKKELDEANRKIKVPVKVYPAITKNPPRLIEDDMLINSKLIRSGLIEAVFPLAEDMYIVSYFIARMVYYGIVNDQKSFEVLFQFREVLNKIWKDLEMSDAKAPKARMKDFWHCINKFELEDIK